MIHSVKPPDGNRLGELLFPDNINGKRAQEQAQQEAKRFLKKKNWLLVQLTYYEIALKDRYTIPVLTPLLRACVKNGKVS